MELHEIIRQHRLEKGITQEQMAERLFITRQSISRWETGKVNPPLNALYDLADFYNLSLDEFLGGNVVMKKVKFNILSFFGSLVFNFFFLGTFGLFVLSMWLGAWLIVLMFIMSPLILLIVNLLQFQAFAWDQTLYSFFLFIIGAVSFRPLLWISKLFLKCIVKYFRYNMSNIYYEIEE